MLRRDFFKLILLSENKATFWLHHAPLPKAVTFGKGNEVNFPHPRRALYLPLLPTTTAIVQEHSELYGVTHSPSKGDFAYATPI